MIVNEIQDAIERITKISDDTANVLLQSRNSLIKYQTIYNDIVNNITIADDRIIHREQLEFKELILSLLADHILHHQSLIKGSLCGCLDLKEIKKTLDALHNILNQ
jgi:hypothetical protein